MKSRAPLLLMEQLIMLLVFALAAVICVKAFVLSDRISREDSAREQAILQAQSAAETYKNYNGDSRKAIRTFGGTLKGDTWLVYWNSDWKQVKNAKNAAYLLQIQPISSGREKLGKARVTVTASGNSGSKGNRKLTGFSVAWQKGTHHA